MSEPWSIYIGFDPRPAEVTAFAVARESIRRRLTVAIPIHGVVLSNLQAKGLYTRPIEMQPSIMDGPIMWDVISDAPMSTEHACARFLVPHLAKDGWALFVDGDILARANLTRLFDMASPTKAVYCVKHTYVPKATTKMDGQPQLKYGRKNWSSVVLWNVSHPSNKRLTLEMINGVPGRDLHRFCWLEDDEIGELEPEWNYLVGDSLPLADPKIVHFTNGIPNMPGYENCEYADEWRRELSKWAA